jgi:hypothetical protein
MHGASNFIIKPRILQVRASLGRLLMIPSAQKVSVHHDTNGGFAVVQTRVILLIINLILII